MILLIEDDLELGGATKSLLEMLGYAVEWATTASEATTKILSSRFKVALLDLRLGSDDGAEVIHQIREAGHIVPPIIIVSAEPFERLYAARSLTRAVAIVAKPYSLARLRDALTRVIGGCP